MKKDKVNISIIGQRMAKLRTDNNMTQKDLAAEISIFNNEKESLTALAISSYETGQRMPPLSTLVFLARYFNVSMDYLLGLSDTLPITNTIPHEEDCPLVEPDTLIPPQWWKKFHNHPVYVVCQDFEFQSKWALLDYYKGKLITTEKIYTLRNDMKLYRYTPLNCAYYDVVDKLPLTPRELRNAEMVWVEVLSTEGFVRGKYNGWYTHNEDESMLINMANSLTLTYEGCGISYNAYNP